MITELISFKLKEGVSKEQLLAQLDIVYQDFHIHQDGYIDTELIENQGEQSWQMIHHYATMADIEKLGPKVAASPEIQDFSKLVEEGSVNVSFWHQHKHWKL